jgi:2-keto-4-pentenoate hydratase/2-oxohepta-3-ene-1,7-dioic acid hydratase in catechol pathway
MKIARYDGGRIGVVQGDRIFDVTAACGADPAEWPPVGIVRTIAAFERLRPALAAATSGPGTALAGLRLETPIPWPHKLLALPNNFRAHGAEMKAAGGFGSTAGGLSADDAGFFMKSSGSLSGPADPIVLPNRPDRLFHHECELAIVIGKRGRHIPAAQALEYIFGYACLLDITMRGPEERVMRKSYDTFCPVGPWITTADEVGNPDEISLRLWVNGQLRQQAPTTEMIVGIREAISNCSAVTTLEPGDIIASGTMAGVGPLVDGDEVTIEIDRVGRMSLPVRVAAEVAATA